jgi:Flp pilus assembly CpaE family ATPase
MNVAGALAHYWKQKVLVIEADQHSGCFGVSLQIEPKHSVVEVLEGSEELREDHWSRSVTNAHGVDWLLTARGKQARRIAPWEYQRLLTFVGPLYDTVIVDLPEVINEATETVVRRASKVFVVSTPEVQALYLARRRMQDLKSRDVAEECRKVVLNRFSEGERSIQEYEDVLGHSVSLTIGSDYAETQKAATDGGLVSWDSDLGRSYYGIAKEIAQSDAAEEPPTAEKPRKAGMRRFFGGG